MIEGNRLKSLDWKDIDSWIEYDWIIFGTKSSDFLLTKQALHHSFTKSKLLIDLSVPRNIDPQVDEDPRITLFNIDQLNYSLTGRRQQMNEFIFIAEDLVHKFTIMHTDLFHKKQRNGLPQPVAHHSGAPR